MPGKRHDQWQINPGEFSAPDQDNKPDEHLHDGEKQEVAQTRHEERESMIPRRGENPALADLKARRAAAQQAAAPDVERTE